MADVYVELSFVRVGPEAHLAVLATIDAMPSARVVHDHTELRAWHRRARLFEPEWDCRVVLRAHDSGDDVEDLDTNSHPYREFDFDGQLRRIPPHLVELIEALDAEATLIQHARLEFETRRYESELLDGLVAELDAEGQHLVEAHYERRNDVLYGRITGAVDRINSLVHPLRRSGLVDPDRVRVSYS